MCPTVESPGLLFRAGRRFGRNGHVWHRYLCPGRGKLTTLERPHYRPGTICDADKLVQLGILRRRIPRSLTLNASLDFSTTKIAPTLGRRTTSSIQSVFPFFPSPPSLDGGYCVPWLQHVPPKDLRSRQVWGGGVNLIMLDSNCFGAQPPPL